MTAFEKAKIAAAAKCHEIAARERAVLAKDRLFPLTMGVEREISTGIRRLEEAADAIMALKEPE